MRERKKENEKRKTVKGIITRKKERKEKRRKKKDKRKKRKELKGRNQEIIKLKDLWKIQEGRKRRNKLKRKEMTKLTE